MNVKFGFEKIGKNFFGDLYRPVAKVRFHSPNDVNIWTEAWMIVDTGADFTILPRYLAKDLALILEKDCVRDETYGVGGKQAIYLCKDKVTVKIGSLERRIPLAFFDSNEVPPLLGRLGFLETFDTEFLKTRIVVFKN